MGSLIHYSAIATKIRAMESRLLQEEDFERLAAMESVHQAVEYLAGMPSYGSILENQDLTQIHRGDIERLMVVTLYQDFSKLYRFSHKKQREVLKLYFRKYEIAVMKRSLRRIFNHGDRTGESKGLRQALQRFTRVHLEEMAQAETVPDFLKALRDTDYGKIFEKLGASGRGQLFDYEMALDLYYFTEIWKHKAEFLKGKELKMLTKTFGSKIDMLNMMWIYRAKKYYQLPVASIYTLVIPVLYRLKDEEIRDMVTAPTLEAMDRVIKKTYYGRKFMELDVKEIEKFYHQFLHRVYAEEKRKNPYSIAVVTAYLLAKEEEIQRLTTVLEGIRYGLPPRETLSYAGQ